MHQHMSWVCLGLWQPVGAQIYTQMALTLMRVISSLAQKVKHSGFSLVFECLGFDDKVGFWILLHGNYPIVHDVCESWHIYVKYGAYQTGFQAFNSACVFGV